MNKHPIKITIWNSTGLPRGGYEYLQITLPDFIRAMDPYIIFENLKGWSYDELIGNHIGRPSQIEGYHHELWNSLLPYHHDIPRKKWQGSIRCQFIQQYANLPISAKRLSCDILHELKHRKTQQRLGYNLAWAESHHEPESHSELGSHDYYETYRACFGYFEKIIDRYIRYIRYRNNFIKEK